MLEPLHGSVSWRLVVSLLLLLPGASLAQSPASRVVNDAASALGGRDRIAAARTLLLEGVGKEFSFGQGSSYDGTAKPGPCAINCTNDKEVYSFHPGGANAVFADGSVHFLKASIDIRIFARLVTRAGGEVVTASDF